MERSAVYPRAVALVAMGGAFLVDTLCKRFLLAHSQAWDGRVLLPGLLDTHFAWNRGISFSLFWQTSDFGSAALSAVVLVVTLVFAGWAFQTRRPLLSVALGLIVGGSLGNMADRHAHGAVFDFLVMRIGSWPLFVCNTADLFISLGVVLFAADAVIVERERTRMVRSDDAG